MNLEVENRHDYFKMFPLNGFCLASAKDETDNFPGEN